MLSFLKDGEFVTLALCLINTYVLLHFAEVQPPVVLQSVLTFRRIESLQHVREAHEDVCCCWLASHCCCLRLFRTTIETMTTDSEKYAHVWTCKPALYSQELVHLLLTQRFEPSTTLLRESQGTEAQHPVVTPNLVLSARACASRLDREERCCGWSLPQSDRSLLASTRGWLDAARSRSAAIYRLFVTSMQFIRNLILSRVSCWGLSHRGLESSARVEHLSWCKWTSSARNWKVSRSYAESDASSSSSRPRIACRRCHSDAAFLLKKYRKSFYNYHTLNLETKYPHLLNLPVWERLCRARALWLVYDFSHMGHL